MRGLQTSWYQLVRNPRCREGRCCADMQPLQKNVGLEYVALHEPVPVSYYRVQGSEGL